MTEKCVPSTALPNPIANASTSTRDAKAIMITELNCLGSRLSHAISVMNEASRFRACGDFKGVIIHSALAR